MFQVVGVLCQHAAAVHSRRQAKNVVAVHIHADAALAAMIGDLLGRSAVSEFLSFRGFAPRPDVKASMGEVLGRLAGLVGDDG